MKHNVGIMMGIFLCKLKLMLRRKENKFQGREKLCGHDVSRMIPKNKRTT